MTGLWQVLLRAVEDDGPLSCDECFVLLDQLSDMLASGYPRQEVLAIADRYLHRCPDCQADLARTIEELIPISAKQASAPKPQPANPLSGASLTK
jgi:hypothetical protein